MDITTVQPLRVRISREARLGVTNETLKLTAGLLVFKSMLPVET